MWTKLFEWRVDIASLEPAMRALVPWDTGSSRPFLWLSTGFILVAVSVAATKILEWLFKGAASVITPGRYS